MKIAILFFLIGVIAGGYAMRAYDERDGTSAARSAGQAAGKLKNGLDEKLRQWRLTPDDIKSDLARTGEIVRANARVAGERISDARILTVIKAKYVLDRDLSARDIEVRVKDGRVVLAGTVPSPELIGKAVALALDTDGVRNVSARLAVVPRA
jgi:osmotically-inducible protein OsmY